MIGVEKLTKMLEVALYSGRVRNERPLSVLIISSVGAGKSKMISKLHGNDGILYMTDMTPYAIYKRFGRELREGKIRHLVSPDLLNALLKPKEQAEAFIGFMNALIEEGIARIQSKESNFVAEFPVSVGFITAISKQDFDKRQDRWAAIGFLSRMLPVSYTYDKVTIDQIFDYIFRREYHQERPIKLSFPREAVEVTLPLDLARQLQGLAEKLKDTQDEYGFRRQEQLQRFVLGHALSQERIVVTPDDLIALQEVVPFINYECKEKL